MIKRRIKMKKFVTMRKRLQVFVLSLIQKRERRNVLDSETEKYGTQFYKLIRTIVNSKFRIMQLSRFYDVFQMTHSHFGVTHLFAIFHVLRQMYSWNVKLMG